MDIRLVSAFSCTSYGTLKKMLGENLSFNEITSCYFVYIVESLVHQVLNAAELTSLFSSVLLGPCKPTGFAWVVEIPESHGNSNVTNSRPGNPAK